MTFIVLVAAILLVRFYPHHRQTVLADWIQPWYGYAGRSELVRRFGAARLYAALAVPVVVLVCLLLLLHGMGWALAAHLLSFLILLVSFGGAGLKERIDTYIGHLMSDDIQAAYHDAAAFNETRAESAAESWRQLHAETFEAISNRFYECYFPAIFWFVLLGAPGALFYRLVRVLQPLADEQDGDRLERIKQVLDWLPSRLFGLSLALVGNFKPVMEQLLQTVADIHADTATVVRRYVSASIHGNKAAPIDMPALEIYELEELPGLMDRALISWIAIIGLLAVMQ